MPTPLTRQTAPKPDYLSVVEVSSTGEMLTEQEALDELGITLTGDASLDQVTLRQLNSKITAARVDCEHTVYRTFRTSVVRRHHITRWPKTPDRHIFLFYPPLISVASVKYYDENGTQQTLASTEYDVLTPTDGRGVIVFNDTFTAPSLDIKADAIEIEYTSGYATIPDVAKEAARLKLRALWDNDDDPASLDRYERAANSLLDGLRYGAYG